MSSIRSLSALVQTTSGTSSWRISKCKPGSLIYPLLLKCPYMTNWPRPSGTLLPLCSRMITPSGSSDSSRCPPVSQVHSAVTCQRPKLHTCRAGQATLARNVRGPRHLPLPMRVVTLEVRQSSQPLPRARANPRPPTTILPVKCAVLPTMPLICCCVTSVITHTTFIASPPPSLVCRLACCSAHSALPV